MAALVLSAIVITLVLVAARQSALLLVDIADTLLEANRRKVAD